MRTSPTAEKCGSTENLTHPLIRPKLVVAASVFAARRAHDLDRLQQERKKDVYEDANQRVERRIDDLLAPMNVAAFP